MQLESLYLQDYNETSHVYDIKEHERRFGLP